MWSPIDISRFILLLKKKEGLTHGGHKPVKIWNQTIEKSKFLDYETLIKEDLIDYKGRLFKLNYEVKKTG